VTKRFTPVGDAEPAPDAEGTMISKSNYLIGALAVAAVMIGALPAAQGIGASTKELPNVQVNRGAKGDRMAEPRTIAVKKAPTETAREIIKNPDRPGRRQIMDGCDPMFSPVTVPTMAHIAGRCVG
jgi:hypothetical protein